MNDHSIRQLAAAVTLQAVKDYFQSSTAKKQLILKDLRSGWMRDFTNGTSVNVAEQLEKHPKAIRERLCRHAKEEETMIIINEVTDDDNKFIMTLGTEQFCAYAPSKEEALVLLGNKVNSGYYFDIIEVTAMAKSVNKTIEEFVFDADLYPCPKLNIYFPKLKIEEISI